jgi:hypothetical protein
MCHRLLERIERQAIEGYTSTNLFGELAHRLMVTEHAWRVWLMLAFTWVVIKGRADALVIAFCSRIRQNVG